MLKAVFDALDLPVFVFGRRGNQIDCNCAARNLAVPAPDWLHAATDEVIAVSYLNPAALALFGASSPDQILGRSPFELFHPDFHAVVAERIEQLRSGKAVPLLEERIVRLDGTVRDVEVAAAPFEDHDGLAIQVILHDITERKRAENALREQHEYIETILENAPIGFAVNTIDNGKGRFVSSRFEAIYGVPRGAIKSVDDYFEFVYRDPVFRAQIRTRITADMESGDSERMRWEAIPITLETGEQRFVTAINIPLIERNLMVSTVQDVTSQVRAEMQLRKTARLYAALSEVNQVIARGGARQNLFDEVCRVLIEFGGFEMAWVGWLDRSTGEVAVAASHGDTSGYLDGVRVRADESTEGSGPTGRSIREGSPYICNDFMTDPCTEPWRARAEQSMWKASASFPIRQGGDVTGSLMVYATESGFFGPQEVELLEKTALDISFALDHMEQERRRREAEEALREAEFKFRTVADMTGDWEYWINPQGRFVYVSPACEQITGYAPEDFDADPSLLLRLVHPEDRAALEAHLRDFGIETAGNELCRFEYRLLHRGGDVRWIEHLCRPVISADGRYLGRRASSRDVTGRKQLEAQLVQAQKLEAVGRLAGGVAHDFNNMLTVIIGHAEMALVETSPTTPLGHDLDAILTAARRSADLTRQLLAFARRQTIKPKVLDLNGVVSGMLKMLQRLIGEDIALKWTPGDELWPVKLDPSQVDQVLANLVVNARDAMAGAGTLTIETCNAEVDEAYCRAHVGIVPGSYVVLGVSDTGCGMTQEVLERAFEPFFTTKGVGEGTGLGLSTVFGIVKQNNGFIHAYSEPGRGSTFRIWLPRVMETEQAVDRSGVLDSAPGGSETVLVVEDAEPILSIARTILTRLGYTVLATTAPFEAIALAEADDQPIHLLLTDVVMPQMSGRDLATIVSSRKPGLKCLYMSGYTANIIAQHGVLDEGVHFVQKPFSAMALARAVREALDS